MKIKDLEPGRLFQFKLGRDNGIYRVIDPTCQTFYKVGHFENARARLMESWLRNPDTHGFIDEKEAGRDVKPVSDHCCADLYAQGLGS